jgi:UDP-N-acetylglucosamine 3-dehydrogenase
MTEPLRCALLSGAHVHAPSYAGVLARHPATTLVAIWDDDSVRGAQLGAPYGVPASPDLAGVLERSDLEAVVITAENVHHRALCEAACRVGKHVLCEKPLATTAADAAAMITAAERAEVVLATAFPVRQSSVAVRVKEQLAAGVLGRVYAVRATNHGRLPPGWFLDPALSGGGAVMDHTVHVVDLLRWYLEEEPVEVYAEVSNGLYGLAVEDTALLTITFGSGVVATLDPSWSRPAGFPTWGDVTLEIAGGQGTLWADVFAPAAQYYPQRLEPAAWLGWGEDMDAALIADFARAVREGRRPAADGHDGERALAVVLAAYASARTGQPAPVLPPQTADRVWHAS